MNTTIKIVVKKNKYYNNNIEQIIRKIDNIDFLIKNICSWIIGLPGNSSHYILNERYQLYKIIHLINNQKFEIYITKYDNKLLIPLPKVIKFYLNNKNIKLFFNKWIIK